MNECIEQFDELTIKEVEECALRWFVRAFREREEEEEEEEVGDE